MSRVLWLDADAADATEPPRGAGADDARDPYPKPWGWDDVDDPCLSSASSRSNWSRVFSSDVSFDDARSFGYSRSSPPLWSAQSPRPSPSILTMYWSWLPMPVKVTSPSVKDAADDPAWT